GTAAATPFTGTGSCATAGSVCTISVFGDTNPNTLPTNLPFTPLNLGTGPGTNHQIGSTTINNPGAGISTITFTDGLSTNVSSTAGVCPNAGGAAGSKCTSGLYTGTLENNLSASPFGTSGASANQNYLSAQPGGSVTITYSGPQSVFPLLWGTVDNETGKNLLSLTLNLGGGLMVTGQDIATAMGANFTTTGVFEVGVVISNLGGNGQTFTTVTASDAATSTSAFEFVPGPSPLIGHGLLVLLAVGGVLFGSKFLENRKTRLA